MPAATKHAMPASRPPAQVRDARPGDLPSIRRIYAHHVLHGLASFEERAPSLAEMRRRFAAVRKGGFPYLVAVLGGRVAGYCYAHAYNTRSAYRYTVEDSIYVGDGFAGRGLGRALLQELIRRCEALGYRQMLAVIGDSANEASIGLHAALGFRRTALLRSVGFKFGRWVDSVVMQRGLGKADGNAPK
jgi:phosphinothricin acetyltransferase